MIPTIEDKLEFIRSGMMVLKKEADDRRHEEFGHVQSVRVFHHLAAIEEALTTLSWAVKRMINPHGG